tara:strand:- start:333 stop:1064 length:732 start_codon:yes stop_codon:yes gene_type:complete
MEMEVMEDANVKPPKQRGRPPNLTEFRNNALLFQRWLNTGGAPVGVGKQWGPSLLQRWDNLIPEQINILKEVFKAKDKKSFSLAISQKGLKRKHGDEQSLSSKKAAVVPLPLDFERDAVGRVYVPDGMVRIVRSVPVPTEVSEPPLKKQCTLQEQIRSACASARRSTQWIDALKQLNNVPRVRKQADFAPMFRILLKHGFPKGNAKQVVRQGLPKEFMDLWDADGHNDTMLCQFIHRQANSGV